MVALKSNWRCVHVDVKTAFLNGDMDRDQYVRFPVNLSREYEDTGTVYKLQKSLYGLHQAPLQWQRKLCEVLIDAFGYSMMKSDLNVFIRRKDKEGTVVLLYVDDIIFS